MQLPKWKKKYYKVRKEFKAELYEVVKENKAYIPMIVETYAAYKHRRHIHKIWSMSIDYPDFKKAYNKELFGKMLLGRDEILPNLCYIDERFHKYRYKLPECLAMGDALAIAYRIDKENREKEEFYVLLNKILYEIWGYNYSSKN